LQQRVGKRAAKPPLDAEELKAALARLIGLDAVEQGRFGVAVSGGPDSLALLLLAADALPGRVHAATVDHGLRPESAQEAAMVAGVCAARHIPHTILRPDHPISGSVQAQARAARYDLLETWRKAEGIAWLLTAHHADDQGPVLRPLLDVRRDVLGAWLAAQAVAAVDDPSNRDMRFDRARIRQGLSDQTLLDPLAVSASMRFLDDATQALDWMADELEGERLQAIADGYLLDVAKLPAELRRRLFLRALLRVDPTGTEPRAEALQRAFTLLEAGEPAMLGAITIKPDRKRPTLWHLAKAPPRRHTGPL